GYEQQRVAHRDLAAPDIRLDRVRRKPALAMRVGQRREPGLADEIRLSGSNGSDVELVATYDGRGDADRPISIAPLAQAEPVARVPEPFVGIPDRLLKADPDPGRLVVVVLVLDRVGYEPRGVAEPMPPFRRGHEQVEAPLRAKDRADRRLVR